MESVSICTRRRFLQSIIAGAGLGLSAGKSEASAVSGDTLKGWKLGMAGWSLGAFPLEIRMAIVRGLGLSHLEFFKLIASEKAFKPAAIRELLRAYHLEPLAGWEAFTTDHRQNRKVFEAVRKIGLKVIVTDAQPDCIDSLEHLAKEFDIKIAIHNHGPKDLTYGRHEQLLAALKGRDEHLGACLDVGWSLAIGEDPLASADKFGSRLHGLHLRDYAGEVKEEKECTIGKGLLDLPGLLRVLKAYGFQGPLSLEPVINRSDPMADLRAHIASIRETIERL